NPMWSYYSKGILVTEMNIEAVCKHISRALVQYQARYGVIDCLANYSASHQPFKTTESPPHQNVTSQLSNRLEDLNYLALVLFNRFIPKINILTSSVFASRLSVGNILVALDALEYPVKAISEDCMMSNTVDITK